MPIRLVLAWLHLLALGIGPAAVWGRARALGASHREPHDGGAIRRALVADTWWGVAAGLWLVTGLWRLLAGTEKNTSYYLSNHIFYAKMGMFVAVVALEIWPMRTLIRWRAGTMQPNPRDVGRIEIISYVECAFIVAMVLAAVSMTRGYGMPTTRSAAGAIADSLMALGTPVTASRADVVVPAAVSPGVALVPPSGSAVPTDDDLELLRREIAMPLAGVDPAKLHSNFTELRDGTRPHDALDIMAPLRTPVLSAARGRVLRLFTSKAGGLTVYAADSSERFILMYAHLDSYASGLRDGALLDQGQLIGLVGFSGNASPTATHLHFAIARSADVRKWWVGTAVDPLPALQGARR